MKVTKKAIKEFVRGKLGTDRNWALRALEVVYANQTEDEKESQSAADLNGEGFTGIDGEILSSFAEQYEKWNRLSEKQMAIVMKKMSKYWKQVLAVADMDKIQELYLKSLEKEHEQAS